jgi:hypothetical protein
LGAIFFPIRPSFKTALLLGHSTIVTNNAIHEINITDFFWDDSILALFKAIKPIAHNRTKTPLIIY